MLYKIKYNPMHPFMVLYLGRMCQCGLHVVLWSHIGILIRFLAAEPRSTFIPLSVSLRNDLADPVFDGVGLADGAGPMLYYWPNYPFLPSTILPFLFLLSIGWYCGAGVFGLIGCRSLSPSLALPTSFNNHNNNKVALVL